MAKQQQNEKKREKKKQVNNSNAKHVPPDLGLLLPKQHNFKINYKWQIAFVFPTEKKNKFRSFCWLPLRAAEG